MFESFVRLLDARLVLLRSLSIQDAEFRKSIYEELSQSLAELIKDNLEGILAVRSILGNFSNDLEVAMAVINDFGMVEHVFGKDKEELAKLEAALGKLKMVTDPDQVRFELRLELAQIVLNSFEEYLRELKNVRVVSSNLIGDRDRLSVHALVALEVPEDLDRDVAVMADEFGKVGDIENCFIHARKIDAGGKSSIGSKECEIYILDISTF